MAIFTDKENIGKYSIQSIIKANHYTETYRIEDANHNAFFLKCFIMNRMSSKLINEKSGCVREIEYCQQINHRNLISFVDSGSLEREVGSVQYYITDYFLGSLLSDKLQVGGALNETDALLVFRGILNGLNHLHKQNIPLCHNDLDPSNIVLLNNPANEPVLIDFGHVSVGCIGNVWFDTTDLNLFYHSKETMVGIFDEKGDIFSACAVLYTMLTGLAPWQTELKIEGTYKERFKELWQYRKTHALDYEAINCSVKIKYLLQKGMADKSSDRFSSVDEILELLDAKEQSGIHEYSENTSSDRKSNSSEKQDEQSNDPNQISIEIKKGGGNGFKDIAGMQDLKDYLQQKVIFVIKDKELVEKYRLKAPNGMLLYGPPGCGKTYFAEKFAEETNFNFMLVKASDIGSSLVHGSQEKIKKLFKKAENNSPIVLCFDEFDAVVPDRGAHGNEYVASEVNEFLSQMNNCSERGIFIVATSNRPDKIDPAILRTGRIDKQVYVPLPDFEARKEMFRLYLENRPIEGDLNYDLYAKETEGYIASDIAYIVNDAAMTAAFARKNITSQLLSTTIHNIRPSLRKESIEEYENIKARMESLDRKNVRVVVSGL